MLDVTEDQMINRFLLCGVTFTDQSNVSEGRHNNCVVPTHLSLARAITFFSWLNPFSTNPDRAGELHGFLP